MKSRNVKPSRFAPVVAAGLLQRKCACGQHTAGGSNCAACARKEETLQRQAAHGKASTHEATAVPESVHQVLSSTGQPLDTATRSLMESRFGHDFSHVRVHTDAEAAESARAVDALAYTVGHQVVFGAGQYALGSTTGKELLAHELTHVVQQQQGNRALMRAPTPDASQPRTFIIVYGSGQVNPESSHHNVGWMFRKAASQKLTEIKTRLGKQASQHNFVFEYTPTEAELKKVLNKKYVAPVAEVHIFSHGWAEGANLGGPIPPDLSNRPTETPEETQERRLTKEDLGNYEVTFADDAAVIFYGCNIGNVAQASRPDKTFAQEFSDAFGVTVTASTKSTHFEKNGGWHQVPDTGGKMLDFTPTEAKVTSEVEGYKRMLQELIAKKAELATPPKKGGLIWMMRRDDRLRAAIETLRASIEKKRALVRRLMRSLPKATRDEVLAMEEKALKS